MARNNIPAETGPRLKLPPEAATLGITPLQWNVLCESIFPNAKTSAAIILAVQYCQARNLDPAKRPVNIVSMYSTTLGRYVETVWPSINEAQTTAARTGQWAGIDPPKYGPSETRTFTGRVKRDGQWTDVERKVTFPLWVELTVYRLVGGVRCPFTERVHWTETYSREGGPSSEVPTSMWVKRPYDQCAKCAKAAALRTAFPEEATYTAEEMAGGILEPDTVPITASATAYTASATANTASTTDNTASETANAAAVPPEPAGSKDSLDNDADAPVGDESEQVRSWVIRVIESAAQKQMWDKAKTLFESRLQDKPSVKAWALIRLQMAQNGEQPKAA